MRLTSENIASSIKENKDLGLLVFAISTQSVSIFKSVVLAAGILEEELEEYIVWLDKNEILSKKDQEFLQKTKSSKKIKTDYSVEMSEIIEHLNKVTGRKFKLVDSTSKLIKKYLNKGFSVTEFKRVNLYFSIQWGNSPDMKKFIRPITLYNTKFPDRVEEAEFFFEGINKHQANFYLVEKKFPALVAQEMSIGTEVKQLGYKKEELPFLMKMKIAHWLDAGYSIDDIATTISITVEEWSKNPELKPYISISKILDDKFPDRVRVVKSLLKKGKYANPNVEKINQWIEGAK